MTEGQKKRTRVTCGDVQQVSVDYVKARAQKEGWQGVQTLLVDAQDTKLPSSHYTHVITSFAIMFVPKPLAALQEIYRLLVPGGMNGFTTWNYVGWIPLMQRAFSVLPGIPPFPKEEQYQDFMGTGRWDIPAYIKGQVEAQGFVDVKIDVVSADSDIPSPELFVKLFGNMFVGLTTRWFTEEQKAEWEEKIKSTLLVQLQGEYGVGKPWKMPMTANVVTCRKPRY
ncbi:S-adenosyl-L-methionine-dependent methyltransferase [Calocera cornea HHB12733]|uniref:S-adenosyl-L-methionine-dependent methyltransferase n=1 Tax=Calocera cornea HHB12733 TaxID=1353952 RepID=A0A165IIQ5_9BASI|nr:S-adenosyl-L-methionine-dependent methyltransferase [Calocera cornea HHB12733]